jgi:hypothetical protein
MDSIDTPPRRVAEWLAADALRACSRALLGTVYESARSGLPRLVGATSAPPLRGPAVLVETSRVPDDAARTLAVVLPASAALGLVDRLLGGSGTGSLPVAPSAAECGVLAYGAARVLAAAAPALCLCDVRSVAPQELASRARDHVLWPLALTGEEELELSLLLSRVAARELDVSFGLRLSLCDELDPAALRELSPGDVLVSDRWSLSSTTEGWAGQAELLVEELGLSLPVRLERGALRVSGAAKPRASTALVLAERRADLDTLAALVSGERLALVPDSTAARLEHATGAIDGELVLHQGAPGLRVTRCESAASPAHPRE